MKNALEEIQNEKTEFVRISVANLISNYKWGVLWIINKKWLKYWQKKISSIWWAALLYDKQSLDRFSAFDFEWDDCRFKIPSKEAKNVIEFFNNPESSHFETDPIREIKEELEEEILDWFMDKPILWISETSKLVTTFVNVVIETWFWSTTKREIPTIYIWRYFHLGGDKDVIKKIVRHKVIYSLTEKDCMVRKASDWTKLWPNIIAAWKLIY